MKILINGKEENISGDLTIKDLLAFKDVQQPEMVSVQLNGEFVDRQKYVDTRLKESDEIDFLYFMGGGSVADSLRKGI